MIKKSILILLSIIVLSCQKDVDENSSATWSVDESETIKAVEALNISKGIIYPSVQSAGTISGILEAYIVSETRGIIKDVSFEIGDVVELGSVLLNVDDTIVKLSMEQAKQQNDSAQLDLVSIEGFYKKGTASLAELTRARSSANGAKAFYETSLKAFNDSYIKSPINGAVAWKEEGITKGNYLNQGVRVARIVDLFSIRVEVSVGERQISLIELGAKASIKISSLFNKDPIIGKVVAIAAGSDLSTGSFSVIIEAENIYPELIKAGMSSSVVIDIMSLEKKIIIPTDSIVEREGKKYVFIDNNGITEPIEITIGEISGNRTTINIGLNEGDKIIITGLSTMKPGIKVKSTVVGLSGDWL